MDELWHSAMSPICKSHVTQCLHVIWFSLTLGGTHWDFPKERQWINWEWQAGLLGKNGSEQNCLGQFISHLRKANFQVIQRLSYPQSKLFSHLKSRIIERQLIWDCVLQGQSKIRMQAIVFIRLYDMKIRTSFSETLVPFSQSMADFTQQGIIHHRSAGTPS